MLQTQEMPWTCMGAPECTTHPYYAEEGQKPKFCLQHKLPNHVDVRSKRCEVESCDIRPHYGYDGEAARFCANHKAEGMHNLRSRRCKEGGCSKHASCGPVGGTPEMCGVHKTPGTVNLIGRRCYHHDCETHASYGTAGVRNRYCAKHKEFGMLNLTVKKCEMDGCLVQPSFNHSGERKARFCSSHKLETMVDVLDRHCAEPGCDRQPIYGNANEQTGRPTWCPAHRPEGSCDVKTSRCQAPGCQKHPSYGFDADRVRQRCRLHRLPGMVDVKSPRCESAGCKKQPCCGHLGAKARFCSQHKQEGMVNLKTRAFRCKHKGPERGETTASAVAAGKSMLCNRACRFAYPNEPAIYCARHQKDGMVDVLNPQCSMQGCLKIPTHGYDGEQPTFCVAHMAAGMKVIMPQSPNILHWSNEARKQAAATARESNRIERERESGSAKVSPLPFKGMNHEQLKKVHAAHANGARLAAATAMKFADAGMSASTSPLPTPHEELGSSITAAELALAFGSDAPMPMTDDDHLVNANSNLLVASSSSFPAVAPSVSAAAVAAAAASSAAFSATVVQSSAAPTSAIFVAGGGGGNGSGVFVGSNNSSSGHVGNINSSGGVLGDGNLTLSAEAAAAAGAAGAAGGWMSGVGGVGFGAVLGFPVPVSMASAATAAAAAAAAVAAAAAASFQQPAVPPAIAAPSLTLPVAASTTTLGLSEAGVGAEGGVEAAAPSLPFVSLPSTSCSPVGFRSGAVDGDNAPGVRSAELLAVDIGKGLEGPWPAAAAGAGDSGGGGGGGGDGGHSMLAASESMGVGAGGSLFSREETIAQGSAVDAALSAVLSSPPISAASARAAQPCLASESMGLLPLTAVVSATMAPTTTATIVDAPLAAAAPVSAADAFGSASNGWGFLGVSASMGAVPAMNGVSSAAAAPMVAPMAIAPVAPAAAMTGPVYVALCASAECPAVATFGHPGPGNLPTHCLTHCEQGMHHLADDVPRKSNARVGFGKRKAPVADAASLALLGAAPGVPEMEEPEAGFKKGNSAVEDGMMLLAGAVVSHSNVPGEYEGGGGDGETVMW